jgi:hypothetical protein
MQIEEPPKKRPTPNLILHCGAHHVALDDINRVSTPRSTASWTPIPHQQLITTVQKALNSASLTIGNQAHSLSHSGDRYFGLMEIKSREASEDYCWVLGLRNSHDKTFPAGIVAGASVFICDNLSFSGEVKFVRKHTRYIVRDLPQLVSRSIGQLMDHWHLQDKRIGAYKQADIGDACAHDLIVRAVDLSVCSNRLIPAVLAEWRQPQHSDFETRNVWSLFNAFTESLKDGALSELPKRTEALHGLLDSYVGLN